MPRQQTTCATSASTSQLTRRMNAYGMMRTTSPLRIYGTSSPSWRYGYHHRRGFVACLERLSCEYQTEDWDDINLLLGEDGRTWDESIHYPAYQAQYFLMPFHHLYCDLFQYSLEDLCNINDFRVNVEVRLVTREQDKIGK